jgi:hypothetical protein
VRPVFGLIEMRGMLMAAASAVKVMSSHIAN